MTDPKEMTKIMGANMLYVSANYNDWAHRAPKEWLAALVEEASSAETLEYRVNLWWCCGVIAARSGRMKKAIRYMNRSTYYLNKWQAEDWMQHHPTDCKGFPDWLKGNEDLYYSWVRAVQVAWSSGSRYYVHTVPDTPIYSPNTFGPYRTGRAALAAFADARVANKHVTIDIDGSEVDLVDLMRSFLRPLPGQITSFQQPDEVLNPELP